MSHSSTSRRRRMRRACARAGSGRHRRAGCRAVSRRRSMCSPRRPRSARRVRRFGVAIPAAPSAGRARRARRARARRSVYAQALLVARRHRDGDVARAVLAARRGAGAPPAGSRPALAAAGRSSSAARLARARLGRSASGAREPKTSTKTRVERLGPARVGDEHRARGPVQPRARRRASSASALPRTRGALGRHRQARLVQAAAEGARDQRRQVELDVTRPHSRVLQIPSRAARPPGPRRT